MGIARFLFMVFLSVPPIFADEPATNWFVGIASRDITPQEPVRMAGYGSKARKEPYVRVASKLHAKALLIQDSEGHRGLILTTDLIGLTDSVAESVYSRITNETGLSREQILINSSHTHAGPELMLEKSEGSDFSVEQTTATIAYTNWMLDQLVEVGVDATSELFSAKLSWGVGIAPFVMNRREHTERGVRLGVNPRGIADRSVPILKIASVDSESVRAVLFGAACHNTTLTDRDMELSGDYAGHAQQQIEKQMPGVQAMFMQGCGGDADPYPRGSEELARIHGMALGTEVRRLLKEELTPVTGNLRTLHTAIRLPLDVNLPESVFRKLNKASGATASVAVRLRKAQRANLLSKHFDSEISFWQFGSGLALVGLPGEVVVDYVNLIENAIGPRQLWVSAYNHDVFGYIPSSRVLNEGGYEMRGVYYGGPGIFSADVESVIVNRVRELAMEAGRPQEFMSDPTE